MRKDNEVNGRKGGNKNFYIVLQPKRGIAREDEDKMHNVVISKKFQYQYLLSGILYALSLSNHEQKRFDFRKFDKNLGDL